MLHFIRCDVSPMPTTYQWLRNGNVLSQTGLVSNIKCWSDLILHEEKKKGRCRMLWIKQRKQRHGSGNTNTVTV